MVNFISAPDVPSPLSHYVPETHTRQTSSGYALLIIPASRGRLLVFQLGLPLPFTFLLRLMLNRANTILYQLGGFQVTYTGLF
jgi:hypothetical protein